jgi:S-adenosylmethionine decarboxylase
MFYIGKGNGSAYVVGKMNGDHWLLYLTTPKEMYPEAATNGELDHLMQEVLSFDTKGSAQQPSSSSSNAISTVSKLPKAPSPPDQTLEILMTHLDPEACKQFYYPPPSAEQVALSQSPGSNGEVPQKGHHEGRILSERLGIDKLLPGASLDSFLFEPCGYSANMVRGDRYATIHVTPENDFSYASFECNVDFRAGQAVSSSTSSSQYPSTVLHDLVARVLSIFQPSKFSISLFVSVEESAAGVDQGQSPETRMILSPNVADGYKRTDRILYEYAGYHLLFSTFEKQ